VEEASRATKTPKIENERKDTQEEGHGIYRSQF